MGLLLSVMIGPVFFALIQHSIAHGFRQATFMAAGILISDTCYVLLAHFGSAWLASTLVFESVLGLGGGLVLMVFGVISFIKGNQQRPNSGGIVSTSISKRKGFFKGLGLNGINPFVLLFWISLAGLLNGRRDFSEYDRWLYYSALLATVFSFDVLKAYAATFLSVFITPNLLQKLNRMVGLVLMVYGLRLVYRALKIDLL
nr:LysE family translocator [Cytophagales bacterium]